VLTGKYTEKCDVWSAGVILYIMLCGYPPFYGNNNAEILKSVKKGVVDFSTPEWENVSSSPIELIKKMIQRQELRIFADEVLKHPFLQIKSYNIDLNTFKISYQHIKQYGEYPHCIKVLIYFIVRNFGEKEMIQYHKLFDILDQKNKGSI